MTYEKSCGAVVFTRERGDVKFVLVREKSGFYSFPKGHMENGETEKETAVREIFEEVRLSPVFIEGFTEKDEHPIPGKRDVLKRVVYFLAEYQGEEIKYNKNELLGAELVSYQRAMSLFKHESSKRILKNAMEFITKIKN